MTTRLTSRRSRGHGPARSFLRGLPIGLWLGLFASAWCVLVVLVRAGPLTTASIEGSTEAIELETTTGVLYWTLPGFRMAACNGAGATVMDGMEVVIHEGARIRIERPESGGISLIDISSLDGTAAHDDCQAPLPVDLVAPDGAWHKAVGAHLRFTRDDGTGRPAAVVLPFQGKIIVGENLGRGVERLLLKGSVTIHAEQARASTEKLLAFLHRKRTYNGESVTLARGDRIMPPDNGENLVPEGAPRRVDNAERLSSTGAANGYLRLPTNDAIQFAFIEPADRVVIQRAGNATVEVELSFWQRLENEPALTGVIAVLLGLLALVDLATRFIDVAKWFRETEEPAAKRRSP